MTNELEKQFFDTFGIEPIEIPSREYDSDGEICSYYVEYPQITDRILLELIIRSVTICTVFDKNVDDLKENVLKNLIKLSRRYHIYNSVRTLFEEG